MPASHINPLSRRGQRKLRQIEDAQSQRALRIPESGLKLADVVKLDRSAQPWDKLDDDNHFSEFHAKFWGKSMDDEEREWDLQFQFQDHSKDDDVIMDDGDDGYADEDEDDEFIPGCYELDIDPNPVSHLSKIWIRAEYVRIYKYAKSKYDLCYERGRAQAIVVTGNPGTGKTVSLLYVLRRRCAEKKPVIWHTISGSYIFVDDGVYLMAPDLQINEFKIFVWTLVDSDQAKDGVPPHLVENRTRLFILYASSPNKVRWRRLHKNVEDVTVIMNPWTWKEILRTRSILLPGSPLTDADIKKTFEELGPTPHIIQLLSQPERLEEYKDDVTIAISEITPDKLKKLVSDTRSLSMETDKGISHKLSLISRVERDYVHSARVVAPVTELVKSRLARQLRIVTRNQQIELYRLFLKSPQTRTMCSTLFEAIGLCVVPEGLDITLSPMVRLNRRPNAKCRPRWYSSHLPLTNPTLEAMREQALSQSQTIHIPPTATQEFNADEILSLREGVFYVPVSEIQEALDTFLFLNGIVYILQFTIGQKHSIKPGFVEFLQKCQHVPPFEEWKFIFLIPPDITLLCPEPQSQLSSLRNLNPYSAELDLRPYLKL